MDIMQKLGIKRTPPPPVQTVGQHSPGYNPLTNMVVPWTRFDSRKKLEEDLIKMDRTGGLVARMLDHTASYATTYDDDDGLPLGFKIVTAEENGEQPTSQQVKAVDICREFVSRVGIGDLFAWNLVRAMVHKGNVFTETVIDDNYHIGAVRPFEMSWQIEKNVDGSGNLKSGDPTLAVKDPKYAHEAAYSQVNEMGKVIAAFWPYQISHWQFGANFGSVYAEAVGSACIKMWKRLEAGLDSLGVARVIRAWDTNIHIIPMPAGLSGQEVNAKIAEYQFNCERDEITTYDASSTNFQSTPRYSPTDVSRDIYVPAFYNQDGKSISGDVKKLQPSTAALQHTEDIQLAISMLICNFNMPIDILGLDIGNKPMVDKTKEEGMEAFAKYIRRLQASHATGMKVLLDMELLLSGVNPQQQLYKVTYPRVNTRTAEVDAKIGMEKGQTATYQWSMGMPPELIGKTVGLNPAEVTLWRKNLETMITAQKAVQATLKPAAAPVKPASQPAKAK